MGSTITDFLPSRHAVINALRSSAAGVLFLSLAIPTGVRAQGATYSVSGLIAQTGRPMAGNSLSKVKLKDTFCVSFTLARSQTKPGRVSGTAINSVVVKVGGETYQFEVTKNNNPRNNYLTLVDDGKKILVIETASAFHQAIKKTDQNYVVTIDDSRQRGRDLGFWYKEKNQTDDTWVKGHIAAYGAGC